MLLSASARAALSWGSGPCCCCTQSFPASFLRIRWCELPVCTALPSRLPALYFPVFCHAARLAWTIGTRENIEFRSTYTSNPCICVISSNWSSSASGAPAAFWDSSSVSHRVMHDLHHYHMCEAHQCTAIVMLCLLPIGAAALRSRLRTTGQRFMDQTLSTRKPCAPVCSNYCSLRVTTFESEI